MSQRINPDPTKEISEYQKYKEDRAPLSSQTVTKEDKAPLISPVNKTQTVTIQKSQTAFKSVDRTEQILSGLIELFSSKEITGYCARALIRAPEIPSSNWSFGNQITMLFHGTEDARGYRQWQEVNRFVKKGAKAFYIFGHPVPIYKKDPKTGSLLEPREFLFNFYPTIPVFRIEDTQGRLIPKLDQNKNPVLDENNKPIMIEEPLPVYEPRTIPPLLDVAKKWNLEIKYVNSKNIHGANGAIEHGDNAKLFLATEEYGTFFHELAHKAQEKIDGKLKPGQDQEQEAIAQLSSCVLSKLYGFDDSAYTYNYLANYAGSKSTKAVGSLCLKVLSKVQKVVMLIIAEKEALEAKTAKDPV